jgi:hypothetical protein
MQVFKRPVIIAKVSFRKLKSKLPFVSLRFYAKISFSDTPRLPNSHTYLKQAGKSLNVLPGP